MSLRGSPRVTGKGKGSKTYVVFVGRNPGLYSSWFECQEQVNGYSGATFNLFPTRQDALDAWMRFLHRSVAVAVDNPLANVSTGVDENTAPQLQGHSNGVAASTSASSGAGTTPTPSQLLGPSLPALYTQPTTHVHKSPYVPTQEGEVPALDSSQGCFLLSVLVIVFAMFMFLFMSR